MKWLRTRFQRWKRRHHEAAEERPEEAPRVDPPHHGLILLVHDASGPASYRLHSFADAESAAEFVRFWFPSRSEHGVLAFWAEHEEPPEPRRSGEEVVVLVRDQFRREIVCPFSLPDMDLARAWIAKEAARGLDLRLLLLYWAAPARIRRDDWGRVRLLPHEPPSSRRRQAEFPPMSEEGALRLLDAIETLDEVDPPPRSPDRPATADADEPDRAGGSEAETQTVDEVLQEINLAALAEEFDRLMRKKRWKQRGEPFRGFGSPPGKF